MVRERASRHGIGLRLNVDPAIGEIVADERKVKQVVFNLLSNAVKFTPDGGLVELSARRIEDEVHVAIRDTGVGIAPEDQLRLFQEFAKWAQPPRRRRGPAWAWRSSEAGRAARRPDLGRERAGRRRARSHSPCRSRQPPRGADGFARGQATLASEPGARPERPDSVSLHLGCVRSQAAGQILRHQVLRGHPAGHAVGRAGGRCGRCAR